MALRAPALVDFFKKLVAMVIDGDAACLFK
jgi:hypothetical protein